MDSGEFELPAGPHRLRVSARGRDAGASDETEKPEMSLDSYLVQVWPAAVGPDAIVRVGSNDARSWHREFGSDR